MNSNYIEFYFDCSSPWTYLGFVGINEISQKKKMKIKFLPILVGGVFNSVNDEVYKLRAKPNPLKSNYYNQDLKMWAKARNIQINWPSIFPINSVKAMRGALFFKEQDQISDYALSIFKAYWTDGKDISQDKVISQICEDLNLDSNVFLNFINQETTKNALKKNTQELIDRGGFGSPTYFFNDFMKGWTTMVRAPSPSPLSDDKPVNLFFRPLNEFTADLAVQCDGRYRHNC